MENRLQNALQKFHDQVWGKTLETITYVYDNTAYRFYPTIYHTPEHFPSFPQIADLVLIRQNYLDAYEYLSRSVVNTVKPGTWVVTGQPGIGKTNFIFHVIIERSSHKLPTALDLGQDTFVLFSEGPVQILESNLDMNSLCIPVGAWALTDAYVSIEPPVAFRNAKHAFLVQIASPSRKYWRSWTKQRAARRYVMDVWSEGEIGVMLLSMGRDPAAGIQVCRRFGPCPSIAVNCTDYDAEWQLSAHIKDIQGAAIAMAESGFDLRRFLDLNINFGEDDVRSPVMFIRPSPDHPSYHELFIPTLEVWEYLLIATIDYANSDIVLLFTQLSSHSSTMPAAGWVFEKWMHQLLSQAVEVRVDAVDQFNVLHTIPTCPIVIPGTIDSLHASTPPFYWRPANNFLGIDSVIRTGDTIWAFQSTIGARHSSPVDGLNKLWDNILAAGAQNWRLVVVGHDHDKILGVQKQMVEYLKVTNRWKNTPVCACVPNIGSMVILLASLVTFSRHANYEC